MVWYGPGLGARDASIRSIGRVPDHAWAVRRDARIRETRLLRQELYSLPSVATLLPSTEHRWRVVTYPRVVPLVKIEHAAVMRLTLRRSTGGSCVILRVSLWRQRAWIEYDTYTRPRFRLDA